MRKVNVIKSCEEDFIPAVRKNLEEENKWLNSEIKLEANTMLEDLNSTYLLDNWSSMCLQRANYFKYHNAVHSVPELRKQIQQLCDDLMKFRNALLEKQKQIKENIIFYVTEGISASGIDVICDDSYEDQINQLSDEELENFCPHFRKNEEI